MFKLYIFMWNIGFLKAWNSTHPESTLFKLIRCHQSRCRRSPAQYTCESYLIWVISGTILLNIISYIVLSIFLAIADLLKYLLYHYSFRCPFYTKEGIQNVIPNFTRQIWMSPCGFFSSSVQILKLYLYLVIFRSIFDSDTWQYVVYMMTQKKSDWLRFIL